MSKKDVAMSFKLQTMAYKMTMLNLPEKAVLTALAFTAGADSFCFPSYRDLLEKTGIGSKSTLAKTLSILEEAGFFVKKAHSKIGEGRTVNTYRLLFDETWFEFIQQEGSKSPRPVLIESVRLGLIEKINRLRDDKKRAISPDLEHRKIHPSNPISSRGVHEPSYNHHIEPSLNIYGEEKPVEKFDNKQPKTSKTSATRLSANWEPSAQDISFCVSTRPDLNVNNVADEFRDYWIAVPGAKGKKEDWPATWRNWVRKQFVKQGGSVVKQQPPKQSRMSLAGIDYNEGVNPDGSF